MVALEIRFDEKTHTYWDGKKKIPGVTDVLRKVGLTKSYEGVDPYFATRGIATHLCNELWLKGTLDESTIDAQVLPFHMAFRKHLDKTGYEPTLVEKILYSSFLGYAGRIDYYGKQDGKMVLKDAKCTKNHDRGSDYQLCLQAYALVECGYPVDKMEILELHEDGSYDAFEYPFDIEIAPAIMRLYRRRVA